MDNTLDVKFDKMIELLTKITQSLQSTNTESKKTPKASNIASGINQPATGTADANTPREVIKEATPVSVEDYGEKAKKFWGDLFDKYFKEKEKEKLPEKEKKSGFWSTLLTVFGAIILAAIEYVEKKIMPAIKEFFTLIKGKFFDILKWFEELWISIKESKIGKIIKDMFDDIIGKFEEIWISIKESKIGKSFLKLVKGVKKFFRGAKLKVFKFLRKSKLGRTVLKVFRGIAKGIKFVFGSIGKVFKLFGKGAVKGIKFGGKIISGILKVIKFVFKGIGGAGKIMAKLLPGVKVLGKVIGKLFFPLTILMGAFDIFDGIFTTVKKEGLSFTSVLKGFAVGLIKILTLGFIDTDKIQETMNKAIDKLSDFFTNIWEFFKNLPGIITTFIKNHPILRTGLAAITGGTSEIGLVVADKLAKKASEETDRIAAMEKRLADQKAKKTANRLSQSTPNQDFVSRPGQPAIPFTGKDTIVGFKTGGPFDVMSKESLNVQKDSLIQNKRVVELMVRAIQLLDQLNVNLKTSTSTQTTIVNAPKTNNVSFGKTPSQTAFRLGVVN